MEKHICACKRIYFVEENHNPDAEGSPFPLCQKSMEDLLQEIEDLRQAVRCRIEQKAKFEAKR